MAGRLLAYGYCDLDRRIWRRVDGDRGDRYGYDALGQVTDVKYDALDPQTGTPTDWSRLVQYQWDPVGIGHGHRILDRRIWRRVDGATKFNIQ